MGATTRAKGKLLDRGDDAPPDLIVGDIPRGERARVYISLGEYEGKLRIGLRVWRVMPKIGEGYRPTSKGLVVWPDELEATIAALTRARDLVAEKRPELLDPPG